MNPASFTFVGAGALGRGLAALLAAAGTEVTLHARPARAATLLANDRIRVGGVRPVEVPVAADGAPGVIGVVAEPKQIAPGSAVIFTVKGRDLLEAVADVRRHWRPVEPAVAWVAGLQNGVVKDDVLVDAFGAERVVGAATVLGARTAPESDEVLVTGLGRTYFGEFTAARSDRVERAHAAFVRAGLPCEVMPDIRSLLWTKCANAAGAFGVSALTRLPSTVMMTREPLVLAYLDLLREAALLAAAEGVAVTDHPDLPMGSYLSEPAEQVAASIASAVRRAAAGAPPSYSSMAQDVIAGRPTEVEEVFGDLVRRGEQHRAEIPLLRQTYRLLAGLQPSG